MDRSNILSFEIRIVAIIVKIFAISFLIEYLLNAYIVVYTPLIQEGLPI